MLRDERRERERETEEIEMDAVLECRRVGRLPQNSTHTHKVVTGTCHMEYSGKVGHCLSYPPTPTPSLPLCVWVVYRRHVNR